MKRRQKAEGGRQKAAGGKRQAVGGRRKVAGALVLVLCAASALRSQDVDLAAPLPGARSPRNASYTINVRLDPSSRTLNGTETLTWRNITTRPASDLQFHLYYNAWKNIRSTWMRERLIDRDPNEIASRPADDWSWIEVTSIRLLGDEGAPFLDLTARKRYIAPDDRNADDQTVLAVPLDQAVAPGQTIRVELAWRSKIPRTFSRTGAVGTYFFFAQWFPKIGVLEESGWNCHQFHAGTEFFSDFGIYDVRMTVPAGWILGASGREVRRADNADGTTTHEYHAEDVHDFAWTTSPDYLERRARFEHPTLPPVEMRLLLQPEHAGQAERHFAATRAALRYYGEWYGPYPYGHVTVVDPAYQSGAGGMEYPTLFTAGSRWWAPRDVTQPEGVTVHEAGHQFWYGIVANNEFGHAWMDEGLNTFSTARTIEQAFQPNFWAKRYFGGFVPYVFHDVRFSRATDGNGLNGYRAAAESDAQSTPSFRYWPPTGGNITYNKTALWLHTIERTVGWATLQKAMSTFFSRWQFRHPKPEDFFDALDEASGANPLVRQIIIEAHHGSNVFDYGIAELSSREEGRAHRTIVVVRRFGEAILPVDIVTTFENGEKRTEHWHGADRWTMYTYTLPARALHAQVDPERKLLLDINYTNNSRSLRPLGRQASLKWMLKWMVWLQDALLTYGFFV